MIGTLWDSINLALSVALLVVALVALHTSKNWTQHKQRKETVTPPVRKGNDYFTILNTKSRHSGLGILPPSATYATNNSCSETRLKLTMLRQETPTQNLKQHTEDATQAEVTAHSTNNNTSTVGEHATQQQ
jgi:hypothetical protein